MGKRILEVNPDIVCLQENTPNGLKRLKGYKTVGSCNAQKGLTNSILVKSILTSKVSDVKYIDITFNADTERCVVIMEIDGIKIANIHLTGGRDDDIEYEYLLTIKKDQLNELITVSNPDIIIGDFNAEDTSVNAKKSLSKYPFYNDLSLKEKKVFLKYYLSGHNYLKKTKYKKAYTLNHVGKTSVYGGTPDWMYYLKDKINILSVENIYSLDVTDHNGVFVNIKII